MSGARCGDATRMRRHFRARSGSFRGGAPSARRPCGHWLSAKRVCWLVCSLSMSTVVRVAHSASCFCLAWAARLGGVEFALAGADELDQTFLALVRLHQARWQAQGQSGVLADSRVLEWHRQALPLLQRSGLLRLCSLRLNGETIAVQYSMV